MLVLLLGSLQHLLQVGNAVVLLLLGRTDDPLEVALAAIEDDGGAIVLVAEQFVVRDHLLAALILVATLELDFAKEITCHSINSIELALDPAVGAGVRILLEPVRLAVTAQGLLASFTLDWVL